jgi:ParB/RepB/Spo0J family partition protein
LVIGKRFRPPQDENVAKLVESLKILEQPRAITVREDPHDDGKYIVVAGATLVEAAKKLNWPTVRADIVKCTKAQARLWEIAENLYRTNLTAMEESKHIAEWLRLVSEREQDVLKSKIGRPEGAITKAARELPIKGKTQQARRKRLERGLKIGSRISAEVEAAAKEAGLDDKSSALYKIANEDTATAQLKKVRELARRKSQAKSSAHRFGKRKTKKGKRFAPNPPLSTGEEKALASLIDAWNDATDLKTVFAKVSSAVRGEFFKLLRSLADGEANLETELQPIEKEEDETGDDQEDASAGKDDENGDENDDEDNGEDGEDGEDHVGEQANDDDWTP